MPEQRLIDANDITTKAQPADYFVKHGNGKTPVVGLYYVLSSPTVNAVVLPCDIKTTVYHVYSPKHPANPEDIGKWFVSEGWVSRFLYGVKGFSAEIQWIGTLPVTEFGKTLFFTKEAAEAALAERRADG